MKRALLLGCVLMLTACCAHPPQKQGYHQTKAIPVAGEGGWDLVTVDSDAGRVYVTHKTKLDVLDAHSGAILGEVTPLDGAHGVAIVPDLGIGFASSGNENRVIVFDLQSFAVTGRIATGKKPDTVIYDPATKRVFVFNAGSDNATVIDPARRKKIGTVKLEGAPEFAVADGKGTVFVNIEDRNELVAIDAHRRKVVRNWPLAPCDEPASLAMDHATRRLFAGCGNSLLAVVDADSGRVIATLPIGQHVDSTVFDPATREIISAAADGTLTVIHEDDADHYHVAEVVKTKPRSRTVGLDAKTHRLFVPSAEFGPAPPASPQNPKARPPVLPGTFGVLIYDR